MATPNIEQLRVWLDDERFGPLQSVGTLSRGERGTVRFTYEREWLKHARSFELSPELALLEKTFFQKDSNFGVFMDSCPDRWGQVLMQRKETCEARDEGRKPRTLGPWEFLTGVQDYARLGAFRFSLPGEEGYLADEALSAPSVMKITELQEAAWELTRKNVEDCYKIKRWLKVLVAAGSSLGGARPNVEDHGI